MLDNAIETTLRQGCLTSVNLVPTKYSHFFNLHLWPESVMHGGVIGKFSYSVIIAIVAHAQNYSCEHLEQYAEEQGCYLYRNYYDKICYGMRCSGSGPNGSNITYLYRRFSVQRCQDPVTVYTYVRMRRNGYYYRFSYTFDQSETIDNPYDYYYYNGRNISYTAILDRNATHLGFEVLNMMCACECTLN